MNDPWGAALIRRRLMQEPPGFESLLQLLVDADAVARVRGDRYGLCDQLDNDGQPYPSAALADWIDVARHQYHIQPTVRGMSELPPPNAAE